MSEGKATKQTKERLGPLELNFEGLEDGYRITVKGDAEKIKTQRKVAGSFLNFLRQADKAGWFLPLPWKWLLAFWSRYNDKKNPDESE